MLLVVPPQWLVCTLGFGIFSFISFMRFISWYWLNVSQCISMYLNVSQCISMHLNATHELVLTFTFSCCRTNNSQFRLGRWSHAPELRLPRTGTRWLTQGLPGTPRDLAMACNGLQWHHGCVQVLRLGALQLPDQVFSTFLHQIMEKVMFHGFMEKFFSELMSSKVGNPPVTTRRFLGSSFKALSLDWSDLICAFHPRQAIGLDESLKSADTHTSNKHQ